MAGVVIVGELASAAGGGRTGFAVHGLREAEVQDLDGAVCADFDVRRLQVAMDDALPVRGFERLGDLPRDGQGLVRAASARAPMRAVEVLALDQLHDDARGRPVDSSIP